MPFRWKESSADSLLRVAEDPAAPVEVLDVKGYVLQAVWHRLAFQALFVPALVLALHLATIQTAKAQTAQPPGESVESSEPFDPTLASEEDGLVDEMPVEEVSDFAMPEDELAQGPDSAVEDSGVGSEEALPANAAMPQGSLTQPGHALFQPPPDGPRPSPLAFQMIESLNAHRTKLGLWSLTIESGLSALAVERSADMASRQYLSHTTPDGSTVFDLMARRGLSYQIAAENLAMNTGSEGETVGIAMRGFLDSAPHRANIQGGDFRQIGVGVSTGGGRTYFTLLFVG
jgi:uncharacterized protein YkwD